MHDPGYLCYPPRPSSLSLAPTVALKASFGTKRGIYEFFLVLPVAGRGFRGEDGIHRVFCGETLNAFKAGGQGAGWGWQGEGCWMNIFMIIVRFSLYSWCHFRDLLTLHRNVCVSVPCAFNA